MNFMDIIKRHNTTHSNFDKTLFTIMRQSILAVPILLHPPSSPQLAYYHFLLITKMENSLQREKKACQISNNLPCQQSRTDANLKILKSGRPLILHQGTSSEPPKQCEKQSSTESSTKKTSNFKKNSPRIGQNQCENTYFKYYPSYPGDLVTHTEDWEILPVSRRLLYNLGELVQMKLL